MIEREGAVMYCRYLLIEVAMASPDEGKGKDGEYDLNGSNRENTIVITCTQHLTCTRT